MPHALIIDLGAASRRRGPLRSSLESRGWETSTFRRPAPPRGVDAELLRARWVDCHFAVVVHAPPHLIRALQRMAPRPVLRLRRPETWGRHARVVA